MGKQSVHDTWEQERQGDNIIYIYIHKVALGIVLFLFLISIL